MKKVIISCSILSFVFLSAQNVEHNPNQDPVGKQKQEIQNPTQQEYKVLNGISRYSEVQKIDYIVNSVKVEKEDLLLIDPNEIESLEVLKGKDLHGGEKRGTIIVNTKDKLYRIPPQKKEKPIKLEDYKEEMKKDPILAI